MRCFDTGVDVAYNSRMDTRTRWNTYADNRTAQKRDARRRQAVRGERASLATAEALERMWIGSEAAWKRWEAQE